MTRACSQGWGDRRPESMRTKPMAEMTAETVILEFGTPDNLSSHVSAFLIAAELGNFIDSRAAWETTLVVDHLIRAAVEAEREAAYLRGYNDGWSAFKKHCAMNDGCALAAAESGEMLTQDQIRARAKQQNPA